MKALRPGEAKTLIFSFCYFLLLLASYYILRPIRDGSVALLGIEEVKYLNLVVLAAMLVLTPLFGGLMSRIPRATVLPRIYLVSIATLLAFAFAFANPAWLALTTRTFFVWLMVFNFFVVSLFWSFMADVWNEEQGRRLFGFIAAGGSVGGVIGPTLAKHLAQPLGNSGLLILATALLSGALICLGALVRQRTSASLASQSERPTTAQASEAFGGSSLQSLKLVFHSPFLLGIAALVCITSVVAQFAYIETGRLAKQIYATQSDVTVFYANIDYWTNIVALTFQLVVVGFLTSRFGIKAPLLGLPIIGGLSFIAVAVSPLLGMLAVTNVIRRASEYGLGKPGRDMLYTVTTPQEKYLAKNAIDTLIYRGSDNLGNWLHSALAALGLTLVGLSWTAAGILVGSALIALATVRGYYARGGK